jgi:hypothetical protein
MGTYCVPSWRYARVGERSLQLPAPPACRHRTRFSAPFPRCVVSSEPCCIGAQTGHTTDTLTSSYATAGVGGVSVWRGPPLATAGPQTSSCSREGSLQG